MADYPQGVWPGMQLPTYQAQSVTFQAAAPPAIQNTAPNASMPANNTWPPSPPTIRNNAPIFPSPVVAKAQADAAFQIFNQTDVRPIAVPVQIPIPTT